MTFACAVILYGISAIYTIFLFRHGLRQDNRVNYLLILSGFVLHTLAMTQRGFALDRCPIRNFYEATIFVQWTIIAGYLVVGLWSRVRFLGAFLSPLLLAIGVFALMPGLDVHGDKPQFTGGWLSLHAALFALAYGAFALSSVAGLMYLTQERDLKSRRFRAVLSLMPPLQRLELAAGRLLLAGFVLLTIALVLSGVWARFIARVQLAGDAKILWSILVWCLYLWLIIMRYRFAQMGRRFALGSIGVFTFVMLTFWLSSYLSPLHRP